MKTVTCLLAFILAISINCGSAQTTQVKQVAYACATVDTGHTIPEIGMTLFQDVMAVVEAGADGWSDKLVAIGAKYGEDALACAAKAVYDALTARQPGTQGPPPTAAALRAKTFIDARSYRYQ